ncbi:MAG: glycosyltransferase family 2 protein [Planctomycetota bacterium]|jgi:glycosyltransferase involved in cell wall biosynthesis
MGSSAVWVVIPAYNEVEVLSGVVEEILNYNPSYNIVIVDDGSSDETAKAASGLAVDVLIHPINLGQGAALATGIEYALKKKADIIVMFDADGQMRPEDIGALVEKVSGDGFDVALGSRFLGSKASGMSLTKRIILKLATIFTKMSTGLDITDTHNGIRAFKADAIAKISITQNRMAHASEIISEIARNKLTYCEVPVEIRYTEYSKNKGQSIFNSINILYELFMGDRK